MKRSPRRIAYIALFAAFIAVCAQICLPFPVPFTMQTFALMLSLLMLGSDALYAVAVYISVGAVGAPVFSGFNGGVGALTGATGGYIFGFLLSAAVYALLIKLFGEANKVRAAGCASALAVCYAVGAAWYAAVCKVPFFTAASVGVLPYIVPDAAKLLLALALHDRLKPQLHNNNNDYTK